MASAGEQDYPKTPACDWCREKKIKCGREKPQCKNCTQRKIQCVYSERPKRENEITRTAHLFDEVHNRLDRMEAMMARIAAALEIRNETTSTQNTGSSRSRMTHSYRESTAANVGEDDTDSEHSSPERDVLMDIEPDTVGVVLQTDQFRSAVAISKSHQRNQHSFVDKQSTPGSFVEDIEGNSYYHGGTSFLAISQEAASTAAILTHSPSPSSSGSVPAQPSVQPTDLTEIQEKVADLMDTNSYVRLSTPPTSQNPRPSKYCIPPREPALGYINDYFRGFAWLFPLFNKEKFMVQAKAMYDNPEQAVDVGWLVCYLNAVACGIYGACNDKDELMKEFLAGTERMKTLEKASKASWECIDDTSTLLKPRLLHVQALMMQAIGANEISRPGLCWMLLSNACSLAKAIGLHRKPPPTHTFTPADLLERSYTFWSLYIADKSLSLTFGRPSNLPDYDIDVLLPQPDPKNPLWDLYIAWIGSARIQSEICVRLYSAQAAASSSQERRKAVRELSTKLGDWWTRHAGLFQLQGRKYGKEDETPEGFMRRYLATELTFGYHNTMIMIHRVNTTRDPTEACQGNEYDGDEGEDEDNGRNLHSAADSSIICLLNARQSIHLIRSTITQSPKSPLSGSVVMMWLFSYYPFTAFFILFTNIILNPHKHIQQTYRASPSTGTDDGGDLDLLTFVVEFLESMRYAHMGAGKLFPVAQSFLGIARRAVETTAVNPLPQDHVPSPQSNSGKRKSCEEGDDNGTIVGDYNESSERRRRGRHVQPKPSARLMRQYPCPRPVPVYTAAGLSEMDIALASFITWPTASYNAAITTQQQQHQQQQQQQSNSSRDQPVLPPGFGGVGQPISPPPTHFPDFHPMQAAHEVGSAYNIMIPNSNNGFISPDDFSNSNTNTNPMNDLWDPSISTSGEPSRVLQASAMLGNNSSVSSINHRDEVYYLGSGTNNGMDMGIYPDPHTMQEKASHDNGDGVGTMITTGDLGNLNLELEGPLEFDWFAWERWCEEVGSGTAGGGGGSGGHGQLGVM